MGQYGFVATGICNGVAGQRSMVQIFNPAGSGRILSIQNVDVAFCSSPGTYPILGLDFRILNSALANAAGLVTSLDVGVVPPAIMKSGIYTQNVAPAGVPSSPIREGWMLGYVSNGNQGGAPTTNFAFTSPLNLSPGYGLIVASGKPDQTSEPALWLICDFFGYEQDVS